MTSNLDDLRERHSLVAPDFIDDRASLFSLSPDQVRVYADELRAYFDQAGANIEAIDTILEHLENIRTKLGDSIEIDEDPQIPVLQEIRGELVAGQAQAKEALKLVGGVQSDREALQQREAAFDELSPVFSVVLDSEHAELGLATLRYFSDGELDIDKLSAFAEEVSEDDPIVKHVEEQGLADPENFLGIAEVRKKTTKIVDLNGIIDTLEESSLDVSSYKAAVEKENVSLKRICLVEAVKRAKFEEAVKDFAVVSDENLEAVEKALYYDPRPLVAAVARDFIQEGVFREDIMGKSKMIREMFQRIKEKYEIFERNAAKFKEDHPEHADADIPNARIRGDLVAGMLFGSGQETVRIILADRKLDVDRLRKLPQTSESIVPSVRKKARTVAKKNRFLPESLGFFAKLGVLQEITKTLPVADFGDRDKHSTYFQNYRNYLLGQEAETSETEALSDFISRNYFNQMSREYADERYYSLATLFPFADRVADAVSKGNEQIDGVVEFLTQTDEDDVSLLRTHVSVDEQQEYTLTDEDSKAITEKIVHSPGLVFPRMCNLTFDETGAAKLELTDESLQELAQFKTFCPLLSEATDKIARFNDATSEVRALSLDIDDIGRAILPRTKRRKAELTARRKQLTEELDDLKVEIISLNMRLISLTETDGMDVAAFQESMADFFQRLDSSAFSGVEALSRVIRDTEKSISRRRQEAEFARRKYRELCDFLEDPHGNWHIVDDGSRSGRRSPDQELSSLSREAHRLLSLEKRYVTELEFLGRLKSVQAALANLRDEGITELTRQFLSPEEGEHSYEVMNRYRSLAQDYRNPLQES